MADQARPNKHDAALKTQNAGLDNAARTGRSASASASPAPPSGPGNSAVAGVDRTVSQKNGANPSSSAQPRYSQARRHPKLEMAYPIASTLPMNPTASR